MSIRRGFSISSDELSLLEPNVRGLSVQDLTHKPLRYHEAYEPPQEARQWFATSTIAFALRLLKELLQRHSEMRPLKEVLTTSVLAILWSGVVLSLIALLAWESTVTFKCPPVVLEKFASADIKHHGKTMNSVVLKASSFSPRLALQAFGAHNVTVHYTLCVGTEKAVNCLLDEKGTGNLFEVSWAPLFPNPDDCVTQTVPAYFEIEHSSFEPVIILYCGATTNDTFDEFCMNITKANDTKYLSPFNHTDKIQPYQHGDVYLPQGAEKGFIWNSIYPHQLKNTSLVLEYETSENPELGFCAQTWNHQVMNVTYTVCWKTPIQPEYCLEPVTHDGVASVVGTVPKNYPADELLTFTITWSGLASHIRIFAAVFGDIGVVSNVCGEILPRQQ